MKRAAKFGPRYGMKRFAEGGKMTDEERYGKVGAEIRRLDPEAYKNRPKTAEGNLKLLKELREKSKKTPARQAAPEEFAAQMNMRLADQGKILPDSYMRKSSLRGKYPELEPKENRGSDSSPKFEDLEDVYTALRRNPTEKGYKRGGKVKSSASKRADGIAQRGKTKGRYV